MSDNRIVVSRRMANDLIKFPGFVEVTNWDDPMVNPGDRAVIVVDGCSADRIRNLNVEPKPVYIWCHTDGTSPMAESIRGDYAGEFRTVVVPEDSINGYLSQIDQINALLTTSYDEWQLRLRLDTSPNWVKIPKSWITWFPELGEPLKKYIYGDHVYVQVEWFTKFQEHFQQLMGIADA